MKLLAVEVDEHDLYNCHFSRTRNAVFSSSLTESTLSSILFPPPPPVGASLCLGLLVLSTVSESSNFGWVVRSRSSIFKTFFRFFLFSLPLKHFPSQMRTLFTVFFSQEGIKCQRASLLLKFLPTTTLLSNLLYEYSMFFFFLGNRTERISTID